MATTSWPATPHVLAGTFVRTLAERLRSEGHPVTVVTPAGPLDDGDHQPGVTVSGGLTVHRTAFPGWRGGPFHRDGLPELLEAGETRGAAVAVAALPGLLVETAIALHAAGPRAHAIGHWLVPGGLIAQVAARLLDRDATTVCHSGGVRLVHRLPRWLGRPLARLAVGAAPPVVTCAEVLELLEAVLGHPIAAQVTPMPVEPPRRVTAPPVPPPWRVVFLGRLVPVKGLDLLIDALAGVHDVELHVAGDGPERVALEAQARRLGVVARFHGVVTGDAKALLLSSAHGFALTSRRLPNGRTEGAPVSLMEALSYGLPVVVSDVGGLAGLAGPRAVVCAPDASAIRAAWPAFEAQMRARAQSPTTTNEAQ